MSMNICGRNRSGVCSRKYHHECSDCTNRRTVFCGNQAIRSEGGEEVIGWCIYFVLFVVVLAHILYTHMRPPMPPAIVVTLKPMYPEKEYAT